MGVFYAVSVSEILDDATECGAHERFHPAISMLVQ